MGHLSRNLGAGVLLTLGRVWDEEQQASGGWAGGPLSLSLLYLCFFSAPALVFSSSLHVDFSVHPCRPTWLPYHSHLHSLQLKLHAQTSTKFHFSEGEKLIGPSLSQISLLIPSIPARMRVRVLVNQTWLVGERECPERGESLRWADTLKLYSESTLRNCCIPGGKWGGLEWRQWQWVWEEVSRFERDGERSMSSGS